MSRMVSGLRLLALVVLAGGLAAGRGTPAPPPPRHGRRPARRPAGLVRRRGGRSAQAAHQGPAVGGGVVRRVRYGLGPPAPRQPGLGGGAALRPGLPAAERSRRAVG